MKKIISFVLLLIACFSLAACDTSPEETGSVLQERVGESPYSGKKITFNLNTRSDWKNLYENEYFAESGEIVRMKGLLFTAEFDSLPPT